MELETIDKNGNIVKRKYKVLESRKVEGGTVRILVLEHEG